MIDPQNAKMKDFWFKIPDSRFSSKEEWVFQVCDSFDDTAEDINRSLKIEGGEGYFRIDELITNGEALAKPNVCSSQSTTDEFDCTGENFGL